MHTDLDEKMIARRLRAAGNEPGDAPYDWREYRRRRDRSMVTRVIERHRPAAILAAALAAVLVTAIPFVPWNHQHAPASAPRADASHAGTSEWQERARTRALEGWLAGLPHDDSMVRVGTHVAVASLQDQIAALDDLMSTERVAGAQPSRLDALERQRAQLVSSLAQVRYAEMLASATPDR